MSSFEKNHFQYIDHLPTSNSFMTPQNATCLEVKSDNSQHRTFSLSTSTAHENLDAISKEGLSGIGSGSNDLEHLPSTNFPVNISPTSKSPGIINPYLNLRYRNMLNFPKFFGKKSAAFDRRTKRAGIITDPIITLKLVRQFLQPFINREINTVITRYMEEFFSIAIRNICSNLGENSIPVDEIRHLQYNIMKSATAQYRTQSTSPREHPQQQPFFFNSSSSNHPLPNAPNSSSDISSLRRCVLLRKTARRVIGEQVIPVNKPLGNMSEYDFPEGFSEDEGSVGSVGPKKHASLFPTNSRLCSGCDSSVLSCDVSVGSLSCPVSDIDDDANGGEDDEELTSPSLPSSPEDSEKPPPLIYPVGSCGGGVTRSHRAAGAKRRRNNNSLSLSQSSRFLETPNTSPRTSASSANIGEILQGLETNHQQEHTYQASVDDSETHNISPLRLSINDTFVLGSTANNWLGLGAARGRIYTKHQWLFRYKCDVRDKAWLTKAGHLPNCGVKAFLMLASQIIRLGEASTKHSDANRGTLAAFRLPPWLLNKIILSTDAQAAEPQTRQLPASSDLFQPIIKPTYPSTASTLSSSSNNNNGNTLDTLIYVEDHCHREQLSTSSAIPSHSCLQLANGDGQCVPKLVIRNSSMSTNTSSPILNGDCIFSAPSSGANNYQPINSPLYQRRSNSAAMATVAGPSVVVDCDGDQPRLMLMDAGLPCNSSG